MHYHTYIDGSVSFGSSTILGITTQGYDYGIGISSDISCGIITATKGFISVANTTPIQITLNANILTFTASGIGSTSFVLY